MSQSRRVIRQGRALSRTCLGLVALLALYAGISTWLRPPREHPPASPSTEKQGQAARPAAALSAEDHDERVPVDHGPSALTADEQVHCQLLSTADKSAISGVRVRVRCEGTEDTSLVSDAGGRFVIDGSHRIATIELR